MTSSGPLQRARGLANAQEIFFSRTLGSEVLALSFQPFDPRQLTVYKTLKGTYTYSAILCRNMKSMTTTRFIALLGHATGLAVRKWVDRYSMECD